MKIFKNINLASVLIGVVVGGILASLLSHLYIFNYRGMGTHSGYSFSERREGFSKRFGTSTGMMMNHDMNPYIMSKITSEKQFLKDMVLHHEAAVTMAEQVLALNPSQEVKALALSIVAAQTKEIADMKSWLSR